MKIQVGVDIGSYTFDAAAKTITFSGLGTLALEQFLLITNVTDNVVIYQFNNPALGASLAGSVLTLDFDTTTMSNTDSLQILMNIDNLGQQTSEQSQSVVLASDQMAGGNLFPNSQGLPVRNIPTPLFRTTFAKVIASGVDTNSTTKLLFAMR